MQEKQSANKRSLDLILNHFILGAIVFAESIFKVMNIMIPSPNKVNTPTKHSSQISEQKQKSEIELANSFISSKSIEELRIILRKVDIFSGLEKSQIANLIHSNQKVLKALTIEKHKEILKKLTNDEIRSLLKGVEGVSRLRKSELIEMVIKQNYIEKVFEGELSRSTVKSKSKRTSS